MRGNNYTLLAIVMITLLAVMQPVSAQTVSAPGYERALLIAQDVDGLSVVVDPEVPNVARGEWIYWPITLVNNQDKPTTVVLGVQGVRDWATYRIDPRPVITLSPGEAEQAYLYMSIDDNAYLGKRDFTITASHDGMTETHIASLAVLKPYHYEYQVNWLAWGLLILAILLIIIGVAVLLTRRHNGHTEEDDEDLITYY